nr:hypothetical protein [Litoribacterium kuwaitense]
MDFSFRDVRHFPVFWPTPAVPLVGALLIPVAVRAGLPPVGTGVAIALAGQGMALSSDYIIQIAPTLTATAADANITLLTERAMVLSVITGGIALVLVYMMLRGSIKSPSREEGSKAVTAREKNVSTAGGVFAVLVPLTFIIIVAYMSVAKFSNWGVSIEGGDGAALIGGAAILLLIGGTASHEWKTTLKQVSEHLVKGFVFAFKAMGPVIPIAGFFFIGGEQAGTILAIGAERAAPTFLFDLVQAGQQYIPEMHF